MDLAEHVKKCGTLYLAGAILIGCVIVALAIMSRQPKSDGGQEADERVALDHKKVHDKDPDKVQLWEGGPYWATKNIGAEEPWEYGYYFWWGDTVGYKYEDGEWVASDGSSRGFEFSEKNTPTYGKDSPTLQREGWITADGVLAPTHDAAQVHWGDGWRMPTHRELNDLCNKCDWTFTTTNGVIVGIVRGRGDYASASIFLPAAGAGRGASIGLVGAMIECWSSVPRIQDSDTSWCLLPGAADAMFRCSGVSVRPVQGGAKLSNRPKSDGGKEKKADERVVMDHKEDQNKDLNKFQLWKDGPYWADRNIGADKPWEYGYYFWWGDTIGYKYEGIWVASDGSSKGFEFDEKIDKKSKESAHCKDWAALQREDGCIALNHDAAHVHWGGGWRMPTKQELDDLRENCEWAWTTTNGVEGYVVRGKGDYAPASIFLPAASSGEGSSLRHLGGSHGYYWSSVARSFDDDPYYLEFDSSPCNNRTRNNFSYRFRGLSVRPVQGFTKLSRQPESGGGKETDEHVVLGQKKDHNDDLEKDPGKVQLWDGGPYWATKNIGAEKPWEYGYYFWWGDTVGYKRQNDAWVASDGSSKGFEFSRENSPTFGKDTKTLQREGWITADGALAPKHDAAQVQWGREWRMPTNQEMKDLCDKCDWAWTKRNGVNGYVVRGRGNYASASIFLPAAGHGCLGTSFAGYGASGYCWSSVPSSSGYYNHDSLCLEYGSGHPVTSGCSRDDGNSIRPVQNENLEDEDIYGKDPGKVQLWEGGPYWADRNVGAEKPWEYGYYFWWGDTVGYKFENGAWVASDGSTKGFAFKKENTPTSGKDLATLQREGWITADGVLAPKHDAAQVQWGGEWRMPTKQELDDLCGKCDWTKAKKNGVNGYVVRGKGDYAHASIFLPFAGYGLGTSLGDAGSDGNYWSSVPLRIWHFDDNACSLDFGGSTGRCGRVSGHSVRPVQGFTK